MSLSSASASASAFGRRLEIGSRIVARVEADGVGLREIGDCGFCAVIRGVVADPERRVIVRAVIGLDAGTVGLAADETVELLARNQLADLVAKAAIGGRARCFGRCGGGRGGSGLGGRRSGGRRCGKVLGRRRRWERGVRDRHCRYNTQIALLRHAGMAGQSQHQRERGRGQQTVKSGTFHHVSPKAVRGQARPLICPTHCN